MAACQLSRGERGHHARGHGTAFGVHEGGVPLVLGHEVEFVDRRGRIGGGRGEQPDEAVAERGHRRPVEQVGGVFDLADDSGGLAVRSVPLLQTDVHVELGGVADHVLEPGFEAGDGQLDLVEVLEGQHDLVERVPCERPHRVDHLDEALERHVLVGERGQVGLADALQQFGERGTARDIGAQHERVDEVAEQIFQGFVGAPGHRGSDGDVGVAAEPAHEGGQAGLDRHEQGGVALPGEPQQSVVQGGVQAQRLLGASVRGHRRPGPVGGQVDELRQTAQVLGPVGELPGDRAVGVVLASEQLTLPQGVVRVVHGKRCPARGAPLGPCRVGDGEVVAEQGLRPAVAGDVVHERQQGVFLVAEPEQSAADGQFGDEVEVVLRGLGESRL